MISKTAGGNFTPFLPGQKITPSISYNFNLNNQKVFRIFSNYDYYFAQNNIAINEITTPQYGLWNVGVSTTISSERKTYSISLTGNNLLNIPYYDHLSRFKYFGLLNMGRNIALNFKVKFTE